jgi:hypothetical protein
MSKNVSNKVVVFDLDETLGYFQQLSVIINAIEKANQKYLKTVEFFNIIHLFDRVFRPHIFTILKYLYKEKLKKNIKKILIFTNNQGEKSWVNNIKNYIHTSIKMPIFDQVIYAFKINGQIIEKNRTSHEKKYSDLIKCSKLPNGTEVCFIDDVLHNDMYENDNVFYISVKPYIYHYKYNDIIQKIQNDRSLSKLISNDKVKSIIQFIKRYIPYEDHEKEYNINAITSKKIMTFLTDFLNE